MLPACFMFLRGVVSLDAGVDLTDLQAANILAKVSDGLVSRGSEASTACLWSRLSQPAGGAGSPPAEVGCTWTSQ